MAAPATTSRINSLALIGLKAGSNVFDLSSDMSNISIRDQVVRARLLVRDLAALPERPKQVLVVGAGFAGISAALACLDAKISVTVLETNDQPFKLQTRTNERYVGPLMYEWPLHGFDDQTYPPQAHPPLPDSSILGGLWNAITKKTDPLPAQTMAADAQAALRSILSNHDFPINVDVDRNEVSRYIRTFSTAPVSARTDLVLTKATSWRTGGAPLTSTVPCPDAIILGGGLGSEIIDLDRPIGSGQGIARGQPFWGNDGWLSSSVSTDDRIGVFGAGDGALQDVLRVLTGEPHPLLALRAIRKFSADNETAMVKAESELLAVELEGRWAATWTQLWEKRSPPGTPTPPELKNHRGHIDEWVDQRCIEIARGLAGAADISDAVEMVVMGGRGTVHHVYRETYFTKSYLLNRFLIHLIWQCQVARGSRFPGKVMYKNWANTPFTYGEDRAKGIYPFHIWLCRGSDIATAFHELDLVRIAVRFGAHRDELPGRQMVGLSEKDIAERTAIGQVPCPVVAFPMLW